MQTTPGKIFLSEHQIVSETDVFKQHCVFNFGSYFNENKQPFGTLTTFNNEVLAALNSTETLALDQSYVLILPITGNVRCIKQNYDNSISPGDVLIVPLAEGETFTLSNSYKNDEINFLKIAIKAANEGRPPEVINFNLHRCPNVLTKVTPIPRYPFRLSIGMFGGRQEAIYTLHNTHLFLYALAGAFEAQGRLLHPNDGLALWDAEEVEIEALSNNAVMVAIELLLDSKL